MARPTRADQYGFDFKTLKSEGRHVANNVRPGLPAERAGLRDGDYILEVNGESLEGMEHDAVVNKISSNPTQVDLLVVGDYQSYLANKNQPTARPLDKTSIGGDEVNIDLRLPDKSNTIQKKKEERERKETTHKKNIFSYFIVKKMWCTTV